MTRLIYLVILFSLACLHSMCFSQERELIRCMRDDSWIINVDANNPDHKLPYFRPEEKQAKFPGNKDSLTAFIKNNINWPSIDFCGQGTVYVKFAVNTFGKLSEPTIYHGFCNSYDYEALRIVSIMPHWIPPHSEDNRPLETILIIPIKFDSIKK